MLKFSHIIEAQYTKLEGKGNLFDINGNKGNMGNLVEAGSNEMFGYGFHYDRKAVPFDVGSDIEELNMSIKSGKASLACIYRQDKTEEAKQSIIEEYFSRVHSTCWGFGYILDNELNLYRMNAEEFREFLNVWGTIEKESGKDCYKVKIKQVSGIMVKWLEERAEE